MIPEDAWDESYAGTPIADAAWRAAIERANRIEAACGEWAEEVAALADVELAEMTREES